MMNFKRQKLPFVFPDLIIDESWHFLKTVKIKGYDTPNLKKRWRKEAP